MRSLSALLGSATFVLIAATTQPVASARPQEKPQASHRTPVNSSLNAAENAEDSGNLAAPKVNSSRTFKGLTKNLLLDQKDIWTSPAHLRFSDAAWIVPLGGVTAGLMVTDRQVSGHLSHDITTQQHYRTLATAGVAALVGVGGGLAVWSTVSHDQHQRETGFLAGQAALNSFLVTEGLKVALQRERPYQGNGAGDFFHGGSSFPSEHAAAAWSVAGIIAHEYPGIVPKILAYGLATAVSVSRIQSRDHFPSDVLIGSGIGYLIAQHVYSKHHDPELGGAEWNSWSALTRSFQTSRPANLGSPYVPLDSWIYPAIERLAGLGLVDSGFVGMRPWTRRECARLIDEAADQLVDDGDESGEANTAKTLMEALHREFRPEYNETNWDRGATFRLESAYSRTEYISGKPINDGYHFAQTQINDFGRPYGEGWSTINGFSTYATSGVWVAYFRGEWQTAPNVPAFPLTARRTIQQVDFLPEMPSAVGRPSLSQFQVQDAYVGLMLSNWQITFGRQSLWWGPGEGGPLMFSDNATPLNMFRVNRVSPITLPLVFKWLGPMRLEAFLGQKEGNEFVFSPSGFVGQFGQALANQPIVHGQRISFKPTRNFEFGVSRTTTYGGPGYPLTLHTLVRTLFTTGNDVAGTANKPGDRRSGVDFSYRLPGLRKWLTFYGDGFTDDQFSPIGYFDRSAWHAGLYLSHAPKLPNLDFRVEGVFTDVPPGGALSHGFFYFNGTWRNGYTNNGSLMGGWIGREGQGAQAWTNYWFNARNRLQFNFRHQKVSQEFIPGGGTLTDVGARGDYWIRPSVGVSTWVQYERWLFPVIQPGASTNVTAAVQISFQPQKAFQRPRNASPEETSSDYGDRQ
jgi:hypothetical protein